MTNVENKTKISAKSFNEIKVIAKALKNQIKVDKKNNIDDINGTDADSYDIDDMRLSDSTNKIVSDNTDDVSLADLIDNNLDFLTATNLDIVYNDDSTLVYFADDDLMDNDNQLTIGDVLNITDNLIKFGRKGIQKKVNYNNKINSKIQKLQTKLDNINAN